MSENRVIGRNNRLLWHLPADLRHFREITDGKPFIMGRNSYLSKDVLLSPYKNIILSHQEDVDLKVNCKIASNLQIALKMLNNENEIFILGGGLVFRQMLPFSDYIYLTVVHNNFKGDTFFPLFETDPWDMVNREFHFHNEENPYDYSFLEYKRKI